MWAIVHALVVVVLFGVLCLPGGVIKASPVQRVGALAVLAVIAVVGLTVALNA